MVVLGQVPTLLGFSGSGESILEVIVADWRGIADGEVVPKAAAIGAVCLLLILLLKWWRAVIPGVLIAVAGAMLFLVAAGWQHPVPVVGAMPDGLPAPALPSRVWNDWVTLLVPAAGIALIAFADTSVLSRTFAARAGHTVNGNQEVGAVGLANVAGGFFGGLPAIASRSRTAVAEAAGAPSQVTAVTGAVLVLAALLLIPGVTAYLPSSALAAVVIVAALALLAFIYSVSRPYRAELGDVPGVRGYHDITRFPNARLVPGMLILRFDAPLFFANGAMFDGWVRAQVRRARSAGREINTVVLACEPITDIDSSAIDELVELDDYLSQHGVDLVFAEMKHPVREQLERYRLKLDGKPRFGPSHFAPTVGSMVDEILDDD